MIIQEAGIQLRGVGIFVPSRGESCFGLGGAVGPSAKGAFACVSKQQKVKENQNKNKIKIE